MNARIPITLPNNQIQTDTCRHIQARLRSVVVVGSAAPERKSFVLFLGVISRCFSICGGFHALI